MTTCTLILKETSAYPLTNSYIRPDSERPKYKPIFFQCRSKQNGRFVPVFSSEPTQLRMDGMMGNGDGGIGGQAGFPLEQWFWDMPLCTRWWTTATVLTSALVQCQIVTPFQLFYSFRAVFVKNQVSIQLSQRYIISDNSSTGVFLPPFFTSGLCRWISSSMSSS